MTIEKQTLKKATVIKNSSSSVSLLMVEDSPQDQKTIGNVLLNGPMDISITRVTTGEEGLQLVEKYHFDIILLNYNLPRMNGLEFLSFMKKMGYNIPSIMITEHGNERIAVQAMKIGVYDYLNKCGEYLPKLNLVIQRALEQHEITIQQEELKERTSYINKRLQQEKQKFENIVSAIGAGLVIIDKNFRIIWVNRPMEEWFRSTFDQNFEGIPCHVLFQQGEKICGKCALKKIFKTGVIQGKNFQTGVIQRLKHSMTNRDGERRHYQFTSTPLVDIHGKINQVLCLIQDISQQIDMQLKLIQSEKLAAIGELASGLAHQLNNPLVGILNYAQLLQRKIKPDEPNRELLDTVERGARQCKDIVGNLLNFSRPHHFNYEVLDLRNILDNTLILIENRLKIKNIIIIIDIANSPPLIEGNSTQLQQVFLNILMNSLQAMPDGGEIKISANSVYHHKQGYCMVKISDSGAGIPKSIKDKIFDPFFTTKDKDQGTGLGLSIAYGIIKAHNGKIEVKSVKGKGTTFILTFPFARQNDNY